MKIRGLQAVTLTAEAEDLKEGSRGRRMNDIYGTEVDRAIGGTKGSEKKRWDEREGETVKEKESD